MKYLTNTPVCLILIQQIKQDALNHIVEELTEAFMKNLILDTLYNRADPELRQLLQEFYKFAVRSSFQIGKEKFLKSTEYAALDYQIVIHLEKTLRNKRIKKHDFITQYTTPNSTNPYYLSWVEQCENLFIKGDTIKILFDMEYFNKEHTKFTESFIDAIRCSLSDNTKALNELDACLANCKSNGKDDALLHVA